MPYSTEMFFALLDLKTAVSEASSDVDDRVASTLPSILHTQTLCMCFVSYVESCQPRTNYNLLFSLSYYI